MSNEKWKISSSPLLLVLGAAILWSTGGLFIKATHLSAFGISFGRSLLAAIVIAFATRREGFGINRISAISCLSEPLATLHGLSSIYLKSLTTRPEAADRVAARDRRRSR